MIKPDTKIEELNIEEKIEFIKRSGGYLIDLLKNCVFVYHLDLSYLDNLTHVPGGLEVKHHLYLQGCYNLKKIGKGLRVGGSLNLNGCCSLEELPSDLEVDYWLDLRGCSSLREVPGDIKVGSYMDKGRKIYLPDHLRRRVGYDWSQ